MGNGKFTHYEDYGRKLVGPPAPPIQYVHFEWYITDEEIQELIKPFRVQTIRRKDKHGSAEFFAPYAEANPIHKAFDTYCKKRYAELAPIWKAEYEAKEAARFRALNLDDTFEGPGYSNGKEVTFRYRPMPDGRVRIIETIDQPFRVKSPYEFLDREPPATDCQ